MPPTFSSRVFSSNKKNGVQSFVESSSTREIVLSEEEEGTPGEADSQAVEPFPCEEATDSALPRVPERDTELIERASPHPAERERPGTNKES